MRTKLQTTCLLARGLIISIVQIDNDECELIHNIKLLLREASAIETFAFVFQSQIFRNELATTELRSEVTAKTIFCQIHQY